MKQLDFLKELDLSVKQKITEEEHRRFVDFMYPRFGLNQHPGYCEVELRPLLVAGETVYLTSGGLRIYVNEGYDIKKTSYITWHESSHFLHLRVRGSLPERKEEFFERYVADPIDYKELIADLGGLIFLDFVNGLSMDNIKNYFMLKEGSEPDDDEKAIINIARINKGLLKRLAKNKSVYRSMKLIRSYQ